MSKKQGNVREVASPLEVWPPSYEVIERSMARLSAAYQEALASLRTLRDLQPESAQEAFDENKRRVLCHDYWWAHALNQRPYVRDAKPHAKKVGAALRKLIEVVEQGEVFASNAQYLLSRELELSIPERVVLLKEWLSACDEIVTPTAKSRGPKADQYELVSPTTKPGRPKSDHIDKLLGDCAQLWLELTRTNFPKTITTSEGRSGLEFDAEGPQFASLLIRAIDPAVTLVMVKRALRKNIWKNFVQELPRFSATS